MSSRLIDAASIAGDVPPARRGWRPGDPDWPALMTLPAAALVLLPLAGVGWLALQSPGDLWPHLVAYVLPTAARNTAILLAGVGAVALLFGAASAWLVSTCRFPGRSVMVWMLALPLAIPTYIAAYIYVELFEPLGPLHNALTQMMPASAALTLLPQPRSTSGAIVILGAVLYPYVYLALHAAFQAASADAIDAARLFGAGPVRTILRVTLPQARPALAVGSALVMLETLNDIGASEYLGVRTLTVEIFTTWLNRGSLPAAAQLSCLILTIVAGLVLLERRGRRQQNFASAPASAGRPELKTLAGWRGGLAFIACLVPLVLGFVIPLAFLIRESVVRGLGGGPAQALIDAAVSSVRLAAAATALTLLLGLVAASAGRWRKTPLTGACIGLSQTGYMLPGLVLALGLLTPLAALDRLLNEAASAIGATPAGLIVSGSGGAIVIACTIRLLTISVGMTQAGFDAIAQDFDDSARLGGASAWAVTAHIHLPLLRPALWGAAILVFVECLKELPATLLLRPLNVETLATSIYQHASRGSFEEGATAALLIVLTSLAPVIWLARSADRTRRSA